MVGSSTQVGGALAKSAGVLSKVGSVASSAGKILGPIGAAVMIGKAGFDAYQGWNAAGDISGKGNENVTTADKFQSAGAAAAAGLTFGLVDAKQMYQASNWVADKMINPDTYKTMLKYSPVGLAWQAGTALRKTVGLQTRDEEEAEKRDAANAQVTENKKVTEQRLTEIRQQREFKEETDKNYLIAKEARGEELSEYEQSRLNRYKEADDFKKHQDLAEENNRKAGMSEEEIKEQRKRAERAYDRYKSNQTSAGINKALGITLDDNNNVTLELDENGQEKIKSVSDSDLQQAMDDIQAE